MTPESIDERPGAAGGPAELSPRPDAGAWADAARLALLLPLFVAMLALAPPIFTRGEAREGLVVQGIAAGGDWIAPRRDGILASKPPLYHWIAAGAARVVGESDLTVRLPSALAAWVMVLATFVLGTTLFDRGRAWLAVGALLATAGFWRPALEARVDMVFAAAITVGIAGLARWRRDASPGGRLALYLGVAAAVLTKGPAGAVLLGAIVVAAHLREPRALLGLWAPLPALAAAGLAGGWYVLAYRHAGAEFVAVQIVHENVARAVGFGAFAHQRRSHPLKLVEGFAVWLLPWNLALLDTWRRPSSWPSRLLHAWWMVTLGLFTIAAGKRNVYLLPLYPAIALLAADVLATRLPARRALAAVVMAALALGLGVANVVAMRRESARSPLRAFADAVRPAAPAGATFGVRGAVSENDRLVLAYRLHRSMPRLPPGTPDPDLLVVPRATASRLAPGCSAAVAWPRPDGDGIVLVACPRRSGADERR